MTQNPLSFAIVAIIGIVTWWLAQTSDEAIISGQINRDRAIDYFVRHLENLSFGADGLPARLLVTPELKHFDDDDSTEMLTPQMFVYRPSLPAWEIESEYGWMSADGKLVLLSGEVIINRDGNDEVRPMHITTSEVRARPDEDYFETDEPTVITSLEDRIDSVGMQAWLQEPGRLKFLSQVKMHHVPISR